MQCEHFTRRDGVDVGVASFPTSSSQPLHAKPVKRAWNLLLLETFRIQSLACNLIFSLSAFWSKLCLFHLPSSESFGRRTTVFLPRVRSSQRASCTRSVVEPTRKVLATAKLRLRLEDAYPCLVCFVVYFGFAKDNYWGCFCQILRKERQYPYFWNRISYEKEAQLSDSVLRKER